ncbi:MAG: hypothetical protein DRN81_01005 [Thermoproteota archaeon]|nr:MAG: hypothetical protein DRN81_01005 [Candidatus Korarchaeota archaeon]HDN01863.1 hypothetical protein [Candidatus Bathyarchaeota archaeon]
MTGEDKEKLGECGIAGCNNKAAKEVSRNYLPIIQQLGLKLKGNYKRIPLCREHYRMAKKLRKTLRVI